MSKIQPVKLNYQLGNNANQKQSNVAQNPSFSGGMSTADELAAKAVKDYGKNIQTELGHISKLSTFLNKHDGEVQTQLVNAIFTTTLAPAFIAFNPLSKEDKKTKEYTALRQPISAITAIAFGLGVTLPSNNFMENMASKGAIGAIDLRIQPDKNYLKRLYKKEYAEAEKNGTLAKFKKDNTPKGHAGEFNKDAYIAAKQEQAKETFTKILYEDPQSIKNNTKLQNEIKNLDKYVDKNNLYKVDFKDVMKENFGVEFFKDGSLKEHAFDEKLKSIKAADFLRKTGLVSGDFKEEDLRKFMSIRRQDPVKKALEKSIKNKKEAGALAEEIGKYTSRVVEYHVKGELINEESVTLAQMLDTLKIKTTFKENMMNKKFSTVLSDLSSNHLKGLEAVKGKGLKDFAGNLVKNKITRTAADFKNINKYVGIIVALGSLPFSCGALNWLYPRIVERCFPSLVEDDSKKGGSK